MTPSTTTGFKVHQLAAARAMRRHVDREWRVGVRMATGYGRGMLAAFAAEMGAGGLVVTPPTLHPAWCEALGTAGLPARSIRTRAAFLVGGTLGVDLASSRTIGEGADADARIAGYAWIIADEGCPVGTLERLTRLSRRIAVVLDHRVHPDRRDARADVDLSAYYEAECLMRFADPTMTTETALKGPWPGDAGPPQR